MDGFAANANVAHSGNVFAGGSLQLVKKARRRRGHASNEDSLFDFYLLVLCGKWPKTKLRLSEILDLFQETDLIGGEVEPTRAYEPKTSEENRRRIQAPARRRQLAKSIRMLIKRAETTGPMKNEPKSRNTQLRSLPASDPIALVQTG